MKIAESSQAIIKKSDDSFIGALYSLGLRLRVDMSTSDQFLMIIQNDSFSSTTPLTKFLFLWKKVLITLQISACVFSFSSLRK